MQMAQGKVPEGIGEILGKEKSEEICPRLSRKLSAKLKIMGKIFSRLPVSWLLVSTAY